MKWVILKFIFETETIYKLYRGFYGGYLDGDSWTLNSGITEIKTTEVEDGKVYTINGYSGSSYDVHSGDEGLSGYMAGELEYWRSAGTVEIQLSSVEEFLNDQIQN